MTAARLLSFETGWGSTLFPLRYYPYPDNPFMVVHKHSFLQIPLGLFTFLGLYDNQKWQAVQTRENMDIHSAKSLIHVLQIFFLYTSLCNTHILHTFSFSSLPPLAFLAILIHSKFNFQWSGLWQEFVKCAERNLWQVITSATHIIEVRDVFFPIFKTHE
jgi:hypothetical protein